MVADLIYYSQYATPKDLFLLVKRRIHKNRMNKWKNKKEAIEQLIQNGDLQSGKTEFFMRAEQKYQKAQEKYNKMCEEIEMRKKNKMKHLEGLYPDIKETYPIYNLPDSKTEWTYYRGGLAAGDKMSSKNYKKLIDESNGA